MDIEDKINLGKFEKFLLIDIETYIAEEQIHFDLDGDGDVLPLTDGLLLLRYLFGFRGDGLVANAVGADATRMTSVHLDSYQSAYLH